MDFENFDIDLFYNFSSIKKKEYIKNAPAYALAQINYWTKEYNKRLEKQN